MNARHAGAHAPDHEDVPVHNHPFDCIVAYSNLCTHLSCHLLQRPKDEAVGQVADEYARTGQLVCPCHFSSFDLTKQGLPVNAPATACLPQVELRKVPDSITQVELVGWVRVHSVPYGVSFDRTSNAPENSNA